MLTPHLGTYLPGEMLECLILFFSWFAFLWCLFSCTVTEHVFWMRLKLTHGLWIFSSLPVFDLKQNEWLSSSQSLVANVKPSISAYKPNKPTGDWITAWVNNKNRPTPLIRLPQLPPNMQCLLKKKRPYNYQHGIILDPVCVPRKCWLL